MLEIYWLHLGGYEDGETRYISLDLSTLETTGSDVSAHTGSYLDLRPKEVVTVAGSHQGAEMYLTSGGHPVESLHTDTYYGKHTLCVQEVLSKENKEKYHISQNTSFS